MAIKYQMEQRMKQMSRGVGGDNADPEITPVLRYSDLRKVAYSQRGGVYDELQRMRRGITLAKGVDEKLSDTRINWASTGNDGHNRHDQMKREWFETNTGSGI